MRRTSLPPESRIDTVTTSRFRSLNAIFAGAQSRQTGETSRATLVLVIGLRSSLSDSA
jgi:hypothetical protein